MVVEKSALGLSDTDELDSWEFKDNRMYSFIPYNSVGKTGVLIAFLPKEAYILHKNQKIELKDVLIGISENKISSDGRFKALLPCDAVENLLGGDIIEEIYKKIFHKAVKQS
ncbi:hypothetical protein SDC9_204075 [bioreactor metagenome]|uniref:Uncharacterized protein n=1 Tax=bioreactor metagenome TaxID=1076179 RepID=A0A645IYZ5_9ZZZZ